MKKALLLYYFIVYLIATCLDINHILFYWGKGVGSYKFHYSIFSLLFCLFGLFITYKLLTNLNNWNYKFLKTFVVITGFQVLYFAIDGFAYRVIYGIDFLLSWKKVGIDGDLIFYTHIKPFGNLFYFFIQSKDIFNIIGVNIIPLLIFIYFIRYWNKSIKN